MRSTGEPFDVFLQQLLDAQKIYDEHTKTKGESWRICNVQFLRDKLVEEYLEWTRVGDTAMEYKELLDILNVILMLTSRLQAKEMGAQT